MEASRKIPPRHEAYKADAERGTSSAVRSQFDWKKLKLIPRVCSPRRVKLLGYREIRSESRMKFTANVPETERKGTTFALPRTGHHRAAPPLSARA